MNCPYKRLNLEWRPLSGFEQEYEISNYGDVHILEKEMTDSRGPSYHREEQYKWIEDQYCYGGTTGRNYKGINIHHKKYYIHRLVASTFIPNPLNKPQVNHINGNTKNNYCGCQ